MKNLFNKVFVEPFEDGPKPKRMAKIVDLDPLPDYFEEGHEETDTSEWPPVDRTT